MTNAPTSALAGADGFALAAPLLSITTTILYMTVIALSVVLLRVRSRREASSVTVTRIAMWGGLMAALLFLGFDQQTKISGTIMHAVRDMAYDAGWYQNRRPIQLAAIIAALVFAALGAWFLLGRRNTLAPGYTRVAVGALSLVAFVAVRELSLHHVDAVMAYKVASLSVGRLGETAILFAMATGAARWVRFTNTQPQAA